MAAGNDVEIRIRVRDQSQQGIRDAEGRLRDARGRFMAEGDAAGRAWSDGISRGAAGAGSSILQMGIGIPVLLGLAAAAQQLVGVLALVPGVAGAGAGIWATFGVGLSGVSDALTATTASAGSAGRAVADMSRQIRDANRAIEDAQRGVEDANRRLEDAHRGVEDAARRVDDAHRGVEDALRSLEDAQRNVADAERSLERAQRDEEQALRDVDQARKDAIRTLQDLAEAQSDATLGVESAEIALQRALENQQKTMRDHKATALDRAEAALRVKQAEDGLSDAQREATDATNELADAEAKGVEGSDEVTAAKQRAADAHERTADAARRLEDAERGVEEARRGVAEAERAVADAQRGVADAQRAVEEAERGVADAHQAVVDAQQNLADVLEQQRQAAAGAAGGLDAYAEALAKLSPNAREFVETVRALSDEWHALQVAVQDEMFEGLAEDVQALADEYIPDLTSGLSGIAAELNDMAQYAVDQLLDPAQVEAVNTVLANTALMLDEGQTALGDFLAGFLQLAAIGSEYLPPIGEWLANIAARFREWVETDPEGVREFIDTALQGFSDLWQIGSDLWGILSAIFDGLASSGEPGETFLGMIKNLTGAVLEFVSSPVGQLLLQILGTVIQSLIILSPFILGVVGAVKLWTVAQSLLNFAMDANPVGMWIKAIGLLVGALIWAYNNVDWFRAGVDQLVAFLQGIPWDAIWNGMVTGLKHAVNTGIHVLNGLIHGINFIIQGLNAVNPWGQIGYVPLIPLLAKGGNANGLAIVGERGPELVDLPTGSRVHTAGDTQRMLGGDGAAMPDGGTFAFEFIGNTDSAFATLFMSLVREGKIQIVRTA